jgi:WD40 repeat protein
LPELVKPPIFIHFLARAGVVGILGLSSSPTTGILVSASDDLTLRLWNLDTGDCEGVLNGHDRSIWSICYSHELDILYSCSEDETIKLWDLQTLKCTRTLILPKPYQGTNITGVSGLSIATQTTLMTLGAVNKSPIHPNSF